MRRAFVAVAFLAFVAVGGGVTLAENTPAGYKNLQVLPKTITKDELKAQMKAQARALGVECDYCHDVPDMASDKNDKKAIARKMIYMTAELNGKYITPLKGGDKHQVTCGTCHQGHESPPSYPPSTEKMPEKKQ